MMRSAGISVLMLALGAVTSARAAQAVTHFSADPSASHLDFVGVQAGAEFNGTFHKFSAIVDFSPDALATAHFDVLIEMNSTDTKDTDRDKTLRGPDIFDTAHFPTAHYVTRSVVKTGTGYTALGSLTLHGVTKDVPINFQFATTPAAKLDGTATLKRLDFGVGQGDWKSTEWVGDSVKVSFSLLLKAQT